MGGAGLRGSMSGVGNPYHNAQAESFMTTLKVEKVCNSRRLHSEVAALPEGAMVVRMLSDYAVLRDQARACG